MAREHDPDDAVGARSHEPLVIDGLGVSYGEVRALEAVTATALPGEVTAVTGHSGAGKTSLLWALGGLLGRDRTEGTVSRPGALAPRRRALGLTRAPASTVVEVRRPPGLSLETTVPSRLGRGRPRTSGSVEVGRGRGA